MESILKIIMVFVIGFGGYWGSISLYPPMANIIASPNGYDISGAIIICAIGMILGIKYMKVVK